ncbi:LBP_BPI_CETP domain-containing protein/LBP_BPI_CETP_C domain-containing protein [Cephalotus follicularis]|uniref:LBP_BPI_CETP domain-containing protein/LBP_BPI_CETP_C domain-containing protein n=1 Tax=Cephalotus follicularis TaxID=3775 RepID=A0A1Q3B379_CEPFO|nr:LBP_BPI_CETP domain-containing protein/LBP_BPI_CETP_C domain-containing protein [Cephalotus follicularis]
MAPITILLLLLTSFFIPSQTHVLSTSLYQDQAFTSILISQQGLDFIKNLLITKAIFSMTPLNLPTIRKSINFPFLGSVHIVLSNITVDKIDVLDSFVMPGDTGVAIIASGATCNLSMNWGYHYTTWAFPVDISDEGSASVQVEGMEVGLTLGLMNQEGTLKLKLMDCGCYVRDIFIKLNGGASWLYQGMINAFETQIGSAVENAITNKLEEGILKLDSFLQALPKEIPVDEHASLNVTFLNAPLLSNSSIGFDINGLFRARKKVSIPKYLYKNLRSSVLCTDQSKMLGISLDEAVFNSASALYYDAEFMQWIVDEIPDQSLLNTARWRFIVPQLYKKYPNHDMNLNISLSSPPVIRISENNIDATVYADLIIDVLQTDQVIPVACISLVIRGSGSVKISGNNLAGVVKLNDFTMSLNWSEIGNLHFGIIKPVIWTIIQTVFLPYVNAHLTKGFPLPIIRGFTLKNAEVICSNSKVTVCSNLAYSDLSNLYRFQKQHNLFSTFV